VHILINLYCASRNASEGLRLILREAPGEAATKCFNEDVVISILCICVTLVRPLPNK
jgi:hypothetical protein